MMTIARKLGEECQIRAKNVGTIASNFAKSALQDTGTFKIGSALLASFTLVLARVLVARHSTKKEAEHTGADSDTTQFCRDQALMTTVREEIGRAHV